MIIHVRLCIYDLVITTPGKNGGYDADHKTGHVFQFPFNITDGIDRLMRFMIASSVTQSFDAFFDLRLN